MKTYAEIRGEHPFDWNEFLAKGEWLINELDSAYKLSASWITCACGNQCDIIDRGSVGEPHDEILNVLGTDFCSYIKQMLDLKYMGYTPSADKAKQTLLRIEKRSLELIKEYESNSKTN